MTKTEFSSAITYIQNLFPKDSTVFTKDVIDTWYEVLQEYEYKDVHKALTVYATEKDFAPSIAGIVQYIKKTKSRFTMTPEQRARVIEMTSGPDEW